MRFDVESLSGLKALAARASSALPTLAATAGVSLAALAVLYAAWPRSVEAPVDAVVDAADPVFQPVALSPPAPVPARRPFETGAQQESGSLDPAAIARAVQSRLRTAGCYGGPVNGRWTERTRDAMRAFTQRVNAMLPVERADPVLLALIEAHPDVACAPAMQQAERVPTQTADTPGAIASVAGETSWPQRAPEPFDDSDVEQGSAADPDDGPEDWPGAAGAAAVSAGAGAGTAAVASAKPRAEKAARRLARADRPRVTRKYRKKSSVSRNFRKIQRALSKLF